MSQPIIEIRDLSLLIANQSILKSISLDISKGEFISIIGPNGAGKTSLLKCLMRIYPDYRGSVRLVNRPADKMPQKKLAQYISYVPQSNGRVFPFTVKEFVMMGRYPYLSPFTSYNSEDVRAVEQALELTGMSNFAGRHLDTLSGGERQIVFIAAAVAQGAKIMLLDEPATFLDPMHKLKIHQILKILNRQVGITIIMVTHDINIAALSSHRVVILKKGSLIFADIPTKMMNNHVLENTFEKSFNFMSHPKTGQQIIAPEVV